MGARGRGGGESVLHGDRVLDGEDENILETEAGDGSRTVRMQVMTLNCTQNQRK